jgi:hypothetical protein
VGGYGSTPYAETVDDQGERVRLLADAHFFVEHPQRGEVAYMLETDRSTITLERMRKRYAGWYTFWKSGASEKMLGHDGAFRLITFTKSPERMQTLRRAAAEATASVLRERYREPWGGFLFVHAGDFDITRPRSITQRIFHFATDTRPPISLLE